MAGSFNHCLNDDGSYRGTALLENMGDMAEAVDEMVFVILTMKQDSPAMVQEAFDRYSQCVRGERNWPDWYQSEW